MPPVRMQMLQRSLDATCNAVSYRERERENFTSPFSQHWLMRTHQDRHPRIEMRCRVCLGVRDGLFNESEEDYQRLKIVEMMESDRKSDQSGSKRRVYV